MKDSKVFVLAFLPLLVLGTAEYTVESNPNIVSMGLDAKSIGCIMDSMASTHVVSTDSAIGILLLGLIGICLILVNIDADNS